MALDSLTEEAGLNLEFEFGQTTNKIVVEEATIEFGWMWSGMFHHSLRDVNVVSPIRYITCLSIAAVLCRGNSGIKLFTIYYY